MDMTIFDLNPRDGNRATPKVNDISFEIPTLPAYAVGHADVLLNGLGSHNENKDFKIDGKILVWKCSNETHDEDKLRLILHYHGIRDYSLLFPNVENLQLRERLGKFYKEAESSLKNGNWLSYSLMCGAIYEGILFSQLNQNNSFNNLIKSALSENLITPHIAETMNIARKFRNLVHGVNFKKVYVTRLQAMDMRSVMDRLIKQI